MTRDCEPLTPTEAKAFVLAIHPETIARYSASGMWHVGRPLRYHVTGDQIATWCPTEDGAWQHAARLLAARVAGIPCSLTGMLTP